MASWTGQNTSMSGQGGFLDGTLNTTQTGEGTATERAENLVPIMIGHLLNADDQVDLWGTKAEIVHVVAIVRKIDSSSTKITYKLEDETGSINALWWIVKEGTGGENPNLVQNQYAEVFGFYRKQANEKYILVLQMRPLESLNQLTMHLLEVTYAFLKMESLANEEDTMDTSIAPQDANGGKMGMMVEDNNPNGLNSEQLAVFKIIQSNDSEFGVDRKVIRTKVPSHVASRLDDILEFLTGEGHIYTTHSDDHFRST